MIRKALADRFVQIPDMRWENEEYILAPEANHAISVWTVRGKGSDGEDLNYQGCDIYTFDAQDKIAHKNTFWKIVSLAAMNLPVTRSSFHRMPGLPMVISVF